MKRCEPMIWDEKPVMMVVDGGRYVRYLDVERLLQDVYKAGFQSSGEGYNGEYPFQDNNEDPENDSAWVQERDSYLYSILN